MSGLTADDFNFMNLGKCHWIATTGARIFIAKDGTFSVITPKNRKTYGHSTFAAAIRELNRLAIEESDKAPNVKVVLSSAGYWIRPDEDGSIMTDAEGMFSVTFGDCRVNGISTFESAKWHLAKLVATGKKVATN